jgi:hypothetical protein
MYKVCIYVQLIELFQFLIVRFYGGSRMEEELCLMDSCITNSILRKTKYFQTLTRRSENVFDHHWIRCNDSRIPLVHK